MKRLLNILLLLLTIPGCNSHGQREVEKETKKTEIDERMVMVNDTSFLKYLTDRPVEIWNPDSSDWQRIEVILKKMESDSVFNFLKISTLENIREHYYLQYAFYINDQGQRLAFINAFCEILKFPVETRNGIIWKSINWKDKMVEVDDGGICHWQVQLKIDDGVYFDFGVNAST